MHDQIDIGESAGELGRIVEIGDNQFEAISKKPVASGQVVVHGDAVPMPRQRANGVTTDVTGAASNQNSHEYPLSLIFHHGIYDRLLSRLLLDCAHEVFVKHALGLASLFPGCP